MTKIALLMLSGLLMLGLSACGETEQGIKDEAHMIKVCKDNGGDPWFNLFGVFYCDMYPAAK